METLSRTMLPPQYISEVMQRLVAKGYTYSKQHIKNVRCGTRENLIIEETLIEVSRDYLKRKAKINDYKKQKYAS